MFRYIYGANESRLDLGFGKNSAWCHNHRLSISFISSGLIGLQHEVEVFCQLDLSGIGIELSSCFFAAAKFAPFRNLLQIFIIFHEKS